MTHIKLQDIYKELRKIESRMATKEEVHALADTFEILASKRTVHAIRKSEQDIKKGRVKKVDSVKDLMKEM